MGSRNLFSAIFQFLAQGSQTTAVCTMWVEGEWQGSQTGVRFLEDHPCKHLALGKVPWTTRVLFLLEPTSPELMAWPGGLGKRARVLPGLGLSTVQSGGQENTLEEGRDPSRLDLSSLLCGHIGTSRYSQCHEHTSLSQPLAMVAPDRRCQGMTGKCSDCPKSAKARAAKTIPPLFLGTSAVKSLPGLLRLFPPGGRVYV